MPVQPVVSMGFEVPDDFPAGTYEAVHRRLAGERYVRLVEDTWEDHIWSQYSGAWNALAFRFRACAEHDEAFTASIRKEQDQTETYVQERELFGFFVTSWSAIESLCYALYAIGAMLKPQRFPMVKIGEIKSVNPNSTSSKYNNAFKGDPLAKALQRSTTGKEFKDWKEIRNVLVHRVAPSRTHKVSIEIGVDPPSIGPVHHRGLSWWEGMSLDETTTAARRRWLVQRLEEVLDATATFTSQRF